MNILDRSFDSDASALKLFKEGNGVISTPVTTNYTGSVTIPHGYPTDELIWQVSVADLLISYTSPVYSSDGRLEIFSRLDNTNLYIYVVVSSAGDPWEAKDWRYKYRILIP